MAGWDTEGGILVGCRESYLVLWLVPQKGSQKGVMLGLLFYSWMLGLFILLLVQFQH